MSLVAALLKKSCLFFVAFPVHFFFSLNVLIFPIDSFFKTHFKIKASHTRQCFFFIFDVIFKIKIKVIFISYLGRGVPFKNSP